MLLFRHLQLRSHLGAYLDGELEPARAAEVAGHVRACWSCSGDLEALRLVKAGLRRRTRHPASLPLHRLHRFVRQLEH